MDADSVRHQAAVVDPTQFPDGALVVYLVEFRRTADAVDACWVRLVGELDRRGLWRADGARTAAGWLRRETRMARNAASDAVAVARALADLPETAEMFRQGRIGLGHMRAIVSAIHADRGEQARQADVILARAALWMDPTQISRVARTWARLADPE
jgi:hypothetical protein